MYVGADYYPEHWPEERWEYDACLMRDAGFNVTRLAEFSWTKLEPEEGKFDFEWLDRAVDVLERNGVKVILCTTTATMPKWMYDSYPEIIASDVNGHKLPFGNRQCNCFTSSSYRFFSDRMTGKLAERYAANENVIGWQIDNEFWGPYCFCDTCENAFRSYLKDKFKTIEILNQKLGTIFWSHTYRGFEQVHLPRHPNSNPSLSLEYKRFHSENIIRFARSQAEIIRKKCPGHFITHNMMGFSESVNYYELGKLLDFVSFDYYYNFGSDMSRSKRTAQYRYGAASLDFMRSVKHRNFWIIENSISANGWESYGRELRPGELMRMTYQNIAHGAEAQIWFRWRTSLYGTEQYWNGVLGHDGVPARRYRDAAGTSEAIHKLSEYIEGSEVISDVAVLSDYDDRWAMSQQPNGPFFDHVRSSLVYYNAFTKHGINVDFVSPSDDFSKYKIMVLPAKYILSEELSEKLRAYADNGGVLIITYRSGVKDTTNIPYVMTLPGHLRKLSGIRIEDTEAVSPEDPYVIIAGDNSFTGAVFCDWIIPEDSHVIAGYKDPDLSEYAAATVRRTGAGSVYYLGIESEGLTSYITDMVIKETGIRDFGVLPEGVEIVTRTSADHEYVFVLNHSETEYITDIKGVDITSGKTFDGVSAVAPNTAAVIQRKII